MIAPPTFPIVVTMAASGQVMADPGLGINYALVVHGEQRFIYGRPLHAGDVVTAQSTIESIKTLGRNVVLTTRTEVQTRDGEQVCTAYSTAGGTRHGRGGGVSAVVKYADVEAGAELPPASYPVARLDLVRYCGASGDFNVIHWNERIAKAVGLPDVIAHGMFTMAQAARYVTDWAGDPGAMTQFGVRFSAPVVVPDDDAFVSIEVSGTIEEKLDDNRVVVALTARSGGDKVLTRSRAVVRLP